MAYSDSIFKARVGRSVDRDALEHNRINDRVGPQSRFQTAATLIFQPDKGSDLYVNEKERFKKDFDTFDRAKRQHQRLKQDNFYDARKEKRLENDDRRWDKIHKRDDYDQKKRVFHQQVLLDNKRNSNGMPYDPITLNYQKSNMGDQLRKRDEDKEVRRFVRAQNLMSKNNASYNILTGETKPTIKKFVPDQLKTRVEEIIKIKAEDKVKYQPKRDKYDYLDD